MAAKDQDEALREAARARGFRLVKSRRRKPGGDFGRYGLVGLDSGRECLGFGPEGLTASAEEVHAYLRGGEVASWKRSLIGVVGEERSRSPRREPPAKPAEERSEEHTASARPQRSRGAPAEIAAPEESATPSPSARSPRGAKVVRSAPPDSPPAVAGGAGGDSSSAETKAGSQPLTIREATRRDAASIARFLDLPAPTLAERLATAIRADEPPILAERAGMVGICVYTVFRSLQHGPRGRVTLLAVADAERRQGIGSRLLREVERRLADAGVEQIELLLDIDFDAPTGFLRRTGWERRTNGYSKHPVA